MAGQEQDALDVHMQKKLIKSHLLKGMVKGQTWYLVDSKWYKSFKQFVGMDEAWDITGTGDDHPGPIDNTPLLSEEAVGEIRDNLIEELDYVLVPEEAWKLLSKWYGLVSSRCIIPKKVVEFGVFVKHCKVEVYLLELRLCKNFRYEEEVRFKFSKGDTIGILEAIMRKVFIIPDDVETRLWSCFTPNTFDELSKPESTVQDEGLFPNQLIVIETRNADGSWLRQTKRSIAYTPATAVTMTDKVVATPAAVASASAGPSSIMPRYAPAPLYGYNERHQSAKPGLCGLCNLGNTCFMNSVIQCMSNCPPITKYFLNNEYFNELNEENPLGMKGEIAKAFGELIKTMWLGKHVYTVPHNFKLQVSKFAPQFCGYQQHDSQELLTFLLDGLHEDLNRIKKKPYIELRDAEGRPDKEVAKEAWENYRKRNDSVIVDFFHGLLKSTVVCPECDKVSVTFDPFCYLSLPLPTKRERHMEVALFPFEDNKKPMNYKLILPKKGSVKDLVTHLGPLSGVNPENMIVTEVIKHHFHKIFTLNEPLDQIEERDSIFVYEVPPQNESQVIIPVYLWESSAKEPYSNNHLFGYPFFICIPKGDCTYAMLYDIVLKKLNRYLRVPDDNSTWWNGKSRKISNGESGFFESKPPIIEKEGSCSDSSECSNEDIMQKRIFSFYFVANTNTTSEIIKIHNDGNPIHIPGPIGKSYIVAKWLPKARELFYCEKAFEDSERMDKNKQNKLQKLQLRDCLELYTTKEKLGQDDAWYCPSCKKHQRATKKFDLWSLPRILIIHLKRFSYNRYRRDKIDTHIDFPLCGLNMYEYVINPSHSEAVYDLIGVCNHYGGMGGGHYTAYCQNQNDHKWYLFDDNIVSEVTEDNVVSNAAYVLFYMRRNPEEEIMELN